MQRAAHSSSSRMVSSIRSCDTPRSVGSAYDGNQVIEKTSSSPSETSNSSLWVPSPAFGNRGPRSTRRSGPPTAVITGSPSIVVAAHPRPDQAVVEPDPPLVPHPDRPADALELADQVGAVVVARHQVGQRDHAVAGRERRLEDRRGADVAALGGVLAVGDQLPVSVVVGAEQPGQAGRGVEVRQAEPVHRAVGADQRRRSPVADHRVVLDRQRHAPDGTECSLSVGSGLASALDGSTTVVAAHPARFETLAAQPQPRCPVAASQRPSRRHGAPPECSPCCRSGARPWRPRSR